jgi:hypothetical protein
VKPAPIHIPQDLPVRQGETMNHNAVAYFEEMVRSVKAGTLSEAIDLTEDQIDVMARIYCSGSIAAALFTPEQVNAFIGLWEVRKRSKDRGWGGKQETNLLQEFQSRPDSWLFSTAAKIFDPSPLVQWECEVIYQGLTDGFVEKIRDDLAEQGLTEDDFMP